MCVREREKERKEEEGEVVKKNEHEGACSTGTREGGQSIITKTKKKTKLLLFANIPYVLHRFFFFSVEEQ